MFECIRFLFKVIAEFLSMLFTIDIGNNMSLGMLLCIIFFVFPMVLSLVNLFRHSDDFELFEVFSKKKSKKEGDQ